MKKIILRKIKEREDARLPNNIKEGYAIHGYQLHEPEVGERYRVYDKDYDLLFITSNVVDITEKNFRTLNSVYNIEYQ